MCDVAPRQSSGPTLGFCDAPLPGSPPFAKAYHPGFTVPSIVPTPRLPAHVHAGHLLG